MPWRVLAFAAGIYLLQQSAVLPAPTFLIAGAILGVVLWLVGRRRWHGLAIAGAALLGFVWAGGFAHWRLADALATEQEGRDIEVVGVVAEMPQDFSRGTRFIFTVDQADELVPRRIQLSWYRQTDRVADEEADEEGAATHLSLPRAGERWRFVVRLRRPHGNANPHGFDYEGWLFERNVRATGYVRKSALTARLDARAGGMAGGIERLRERVRSRIAVVLDGQPYAGVITALVVGDQQAIAPELWRLFAATGITHLMSISGLHVTLIGSLVAWLVFTLWRRSSRLPLFWPAQKAAAVAGLAGAIGYAALAGFGIPAQRTLYMLGAVVVALLSGRTVAAPHVLGAALLLVLLLDPWAVLAAGFWLSFGAVAILFYLASGRQGRRHWLVEWGRAQWAITIGLIPALLALFQQFSLVSPLANALAIPLVSLVVTPLALAGSLPGGHWLLSISHALLVPLMDFLGWLAALPGALWQQHAPPAWAVPLAAAGTLWLLLPRGFPSRWLGLVAYLPLFFILPERPAPGEVAVTVLDVGQGEAVHVQTATHDLLFDSGPDFSGASDAGSRIIVPYLRAVGVGRLDALVVSHADRDHAGGAASVLASLPVGAFVSSLPDAHSLREMSALAGRRCEDGDAWAWDGVRFHFMHPVADDYARKRLSNAMSCVLKIETSAGAVLIPGDVEESAEAAFLARHRQDARADVLVAPHHGGRKTSSESFVGAVGARDVIFPVGYRNRFAHPAPPVVERYAATGARVHRTDHDGAVTVRIGAQGIHSVHERARRQRYWHNTPPPTEKGTP